MSSGAATIHWEDFISKFGEFKAFCALHAYWWDRNPTKHRLFILEARIFKNENSPGAKDYTTKYGKKETLCIGKECQIPDKVNMIHQ